jgi:hypothetical protein
MSGALHFFFWDWDGLSPTASAAAIAARGAGGGGAKPSNDDFYPINYDELWAIREKYLQSLFASPAKRQKVLTEEDWPEAILKPRRPR